MKRLLKTLSEEPNKSTKSYATLLALNTCNKSNSYLGSHNNKLQQLHDKFPRLSSPMHELPVWRHEVILQTLSHDLDAVSLIKKLRRIVYGIVVNRLVGQWFCHIARSTCVDCTRIAGHRTRKRAS